MPHISSSTDINPDSIFIGTMTGTSMDGLDLVAVRFNDTGVNETIATHFCTYPPSLRQPLQQLAHDAEASLNQMCQLDSLLGQFYARQINDFIDTYQLPRQEIAAIGSHGQTVRHAMQAETPYTLQIGDPNIIAAQTGLVVVADFRRRDIALNGQGAPLAPAFHDQVFRHPQYNRVIINIGGISNITYLPADREKDVVGFDSGPGNTLMDYICKQFFESDFDAKGQIAHRGLVNAQLLHEILDNEAYFKMPFPKSTGTDYFSPQWLKASGLLELKPEDSLATLAELTSICIAQAAASLPSPIEEYYLCGGGTHNTHLIDRLAEHLQTENLYTTEKLGIHPDWVEASAFAWLARRTLQRKSGNLPSVTNAEKFTILGAVYF